MATQPDPKSKPKKSNEKDENLIVTPISIARARHASRGNRPVVDDKTRRVSAIKAGLTESQSRPARSASTRSESNSFQIAGMSGCFFISLLGIVFLVGGIVGGVAGGGLVLWANDDETALVQSEPTPTPIPASPTPAPAEPPTPAVTLEPVPPPAIEDIIATIVPSVVTVINRQHNNFSLNGSDEGRVVGSGIIIDQRGYIATNHHVIENADDLSVVLADGREIIAELVASEPAEDLAVVKISAADLVGITWGDSTTLRPGQTVYAIGSPLGDFPSSVSQGIVSGLNRALELENHVIDGLLQTDTAINRGSSGGPLINVRGELVGINTFIIRESEERGVAEGIAFAIPANTAKSLFTPWMAAHSGEAVPIPASGETGN